MKCDYNRSLEEMFEECRAYYMNDAVEVRKIDNIKNNYKSDEVIKRYTEDSFLYRLLGRAFRSEKFELIFKLRRYIIDLHWELDKLIKEQENILHLYRGKKLHTTVLQQLQDNTGSLISMNGFLSTTFSKDTALMIFAGIEQNRPNSDYESVLFEFYVDEAAVIKTYADISSISQYPQEEEVLFTIGSIWRIDSVQKKDNLYWNVILSSCSDVNSRIIEFFEEHNNDSILLAVGDILCELGQYTNAENFYYKMLDELTMEGETPIILYKQIAMINMKQNKYGAALDNFRKVENLTPERMIDTELSPFHPLNCFSIDTQRIHYYNNAGCSCQKLGNSDKALEYFNKALDIKTSDPIDKATIYDNIGLLYYGRGDYETAAQYLSEAVKLARDHSSLGKFNQHYAAVNKILLSNTFSCHKSTSF